MGERSRMGRAALIALAGLALALQAGEQLDKHPDGSLLARCPLDAKGQRHGIRLVYLLGGKTVAAEERWHHGALIFPNSQRLIDAAVPRIRAESVKAVSSLNGPNLAPKPVLAETLANLRYYRFLCGVPDDVSWKAEYCDLAYHAALVCSKLGRLDHHPTKPDGMDDALFAKGKQGCGSSNLCGGFCTLPESIHGYMDDSDPSNIDRVGHRRWILNPAMTASGIGSAGSGSSFPSSALYVFDRNRSQIPDWEVVSFPARGLHPIAWTRPDFAWSVQPNPTHWKVGDQATIAIHPVDQEFKRGPALAMNYQHIDRQGFGAGPAIIVRPTGLICKPGALYAVVVSGLIPTKDKPSELLWYVGFY